jgi:UDP-N-acetylglucosamine 2-epimerase (non-hydrolysing)
MTRVLTVFGTRPEAIKLAPVIAELERRPQNFTSKVCVTGQHRELLDQMLDLFSIRPDHDLGIMRHDQSPTEVALGVLGGLERVLREEHPDWVIVQGDTTTTMAGGLGAFHFGCRVAHVEAGLRTFDRRDPWPEEVNRRVAGVVADLHFAPTPTSAENLYREGVSPDRVYVTGNTVIDALEFVRALPFDPTGTTLEDLAHQGKRVVVVTMHRRETSRSALAEVCAALIDIAAQHEDVQIVCPVHPNPNVRQPIRELLADNPSFTLVAPLEYQAMIWLLQRADLVITDSGGVQEEATAIGTPVLVVRNRTERAEGIAAGNARLVGADRREIVTWGTRVLSDPALHAQMAQATDLYGDGHAARAIVDILHEHAFEAGADGARTA